MLPRHLVALAWQRQMLGSSWPCPFSALHTTRF